ncbi:MAG: DUF3301 domain-containing protein [Gammaproteobacteria bacterium]|nr:DUF3301 domain-containing protein [Gammaproteobacteria bacterium]
MPELILLIVVGLLLWYWQDAMRAKEFARGKAYAACLQANTHFLDDSVQLVNIGLRRNTQGSVRIRRCYVFEFSSDGSQRYHGNVEMLGRDIMQLQMEAYREFVE